MPAYNTITPAPLIVRGAVNLWNADTVTPGTGGNAASQQYAFDFADAIWAVDGFFAAAPGTFEIDVQCSSTDSDTHYQTITQGTITAVDATNLTFRFDVLGVAAAYARLLMRSLQNSVAVTAYLTRLGARG